MEEEPPFHTVSDDGLFSFLFPPVYLMPYPFQLNQWCTLERSLGDFSYQLKRSLGEAASLWFRFVFLLIQPRSHDGIKV